MNTGQNGSKIRTVKPLISTINDFQQSQKGDVRQFLPYWCIWDKYNNHANTGWCQEVRLNNKWRAQREDWNTEIQRVTTLVAGMKIDDA